MSEGAYEYQETSQGLPQKVVGVLQVDDVAAIRDDISTLTNVMLRVFPQAQQIKIVQHIQQAACVSCGEPHDYYNCPLNPESASKKRNIAEAELIPPKRAEPKQTAAEQPVEEVVRPPPPFPERLQKQKVDSACKKFLELLKQVHINISLVELLQEVPKYANTRVRSKIPPKLKDPGSFTILITIGNIEVGLALCDLGARINMMPTSVFRTLGLGEPRPTTVTLQLADRSLAYPNGIIENVLINMGSFILPVDFVILDYEADRSVHLIMRRGFLAIVDVVI
ncbi:uncharacterized protein LOC132627297 [Lycium barbarum]|uniref:uncharacterized protein LOC132627297 n=1 Tax=Lycium barbarum TaxID=112863 RepID=UPI00293EF410|nr:uncharacterized protein LOC132627297 [Lycium barbarum]